MSIIDTGGLPLELIFLDAKQDMITTNIDLSDGLVSIKVKVEKLRNFGCCFLKKLDENNG